VPHDLVHDRGHVDLVATLESRGGSAQQPIHEIVQPVPVRGHPLEHLALSGRQLAGGTTQEQLGVADHAGERGAQLVTDARDEVGVLLVALSCQILGLATPSPPRGGASPGRKARSQSVRIDDLGRTGTLPTPPGGDQRQWWDPRRFLKRVRHHRIAVSTGGRVGSMDPWSRGHTSVTRYICPV
jgi:hypothetical protein